MTYQISCALSLYSIYHSLSFNQLNHSSNTADKFQKRFLKVYIISKNGTLKIKIRIYFLK